MTNAIGVLIIRMWTFGTKWLTLEQTQRKYLFTEQFFKYNNPYSLLVNVIRNYTPLNKNITFLGRDAV
jgi:hypothetical protein